MIFKASKSFWIKAITIAIFVAFAALIIGTLVGEFNGNDIWMPGTVLILVFGLSYFFSIREYEIDDRSIIIHRPFDTIVIPKAAIKKAMAVNKKDLRFSIRTFGIGGVFSYTGQFWNGRFGSMTWYVTRMDSAVMLITSTNKKTVVSPDNREKFIAMLTS